MATFGKTFDPATPAGTELASSLDTFSQDDKTAIDERYKLEHFALESEVDNSTTTTALNAQGRHRPGLTQATYVGTGIQVAALTGMTKGCLALDTDTGILYIYSGSSWDTYPIGSSSVPTGTAVELVKVGLSSNQTVADETVDTVVFNAALEDPGSIVGSGKAFDTDTGIYTPATAGYYKLDIQIHMNSIRYCAYFALFKNSVCIQARGFHMDADHMEHSADFNTIVDMDGATDTLHCELWFDNGTDGSDDIVKNVSGFTQLVPTDFDAGLATVWNSRLIATA